MALRHVVLKELEANRDTYLSGQCLAEKFNVSRNAVWKTINILKKEGYEILSVTNKGYLLADSSDLLSAEGICSCLSDAHKDINVISYKEVDSTNNEAKRLVASGFNHTALIVAEAQTAGRGRQGRSFYSPEHTGIYMTLVIQPQINMFDAVSITTAAAVAVVRAIKKLTDKTLQIKWVNDIYLDGKKLCGILTEAVTDFESGMTQNVVIGIGMNISTAYFPDDIAKTAVSLNLNSITRNRLIAGIADEVLNVSDNLSDKSYLREYRECSLVLGKHITYSKNGIIYHAIATAIDDTGGLVVMRDNGETEELRSGEISVRLNM